MYWRPYCVRASAIIRVIRGLSFQRHKFITKSKDGMCRISRKVTLTNYLNASPHIETQPGDQLKNSQVSKALRLSLYVQFALILTGQFLQLFPVSNFLTSLPVMMGFGLLANFAVYAAIIYAGLSLRQGMLKLPRLRLN